MNNMAKILLNNKIYLWLYLIGKSWQQTQKGTERSTVQTLTALSLAFNLKDTFLPVQGLFLFYLILFWVPQSQHLNVEPAVSPAEAAAVTSKTALLWKWINSLTFNNLLEIIFPGCYLSCFMCDHCTICSYYVISAERCFPLDGASFQVLAG